MASHLFARLLSLEPSWALPPPGPTAPACLALETPEFVTGAGWTPPREN